ncbi:MAG: DEAD/DEAH box helicase family protein [Rhodobacteraceae bacterium]|nr:DEAD/DEAH box helicase family protein [Paracoccaceae bacterium]
MESGFQQTINHLRKTASSEAEKGRLFERLMKKYLTEDPMYQDRFKRVWLWHEWASVQPNFDAGDTGIDLVAEEQEEGVCAIQCKFYAPQTRISKKHLDSFISASARDPFVSRIFVDTGDEWGRNAVKTLDGLTPSCNVLRFGDLARRPVNWPDLIHDSPEDLTLDRDKFDLRPHQQRALEDVVEGFANGDRGKLIMACGTGKTFAALRIAEEIAGQGGRVLYLVPSISLLQQSMRQWAEQRNLGHRYIGICSDTRAGRTSEDASLHELEIPVTTEINAISKALRKPVEESMTVCFCTYHSLPRIEKAQSTGAPAFDLIICDEAHRTTGVDKVAKGGG